ncbi:alpha-aminoadipic semialdehyde synthase, mitochondrial-like [Armigeres subalbatus]|uniref:alpha-aminoadipic semialdehyde synthase, mitochondrial-like n=1 Tax=Armigeres subalbatus TaxID=124917 RepID=UPI002ED23CDB
MLRILRCRDNSSLRMFSRAKHTGTVIAIRREDQSVWERRASFSPAGVKKLIKQGVKVIVQPSNRRAYPMQTCGGPASADKCFGQLYQFKYSIIMER